MAQMTLDDLILSILSVSRRTKILVVGVVDLATIVVATIFSFYLRIGDFGWPIRNQAIAAGIGIIAAFPVFVRLGLYRAIYRYSGAAALMSIVKACAIYGAIYAAVFTVFGIPRIPRTIGIIQPIVVVLFILATRATARYVLGGHLRQRRSRFQQPRVLVYGAGTSGRQLAEMLINSNEMIILGFVDDDPLLKGRELNGRRIYDSNELAEIVDNQKVSDIFLAIPSAARARRAEILAGLRKLPVHVRTLPSFMDLAHGHLTMSDVRELEPDDLLDRATVQPDPELIACSVSGKTVLVTGGGGSIGSELCRQIIAADPVALVIVEVSEFALYKVHHELENWQAARQNRRAKIIPHLASVRDAARMDEIISQHRPETVYHAAAYKHVPMVECNVTEGVYNNAMGTLITARAALAWGVQRFVLISTDKAVRPTNVMGATKRVAELCLQALADSYSQTCFTMVRFGNVLDSSGSVVPLFRNQIAKGGPVTVTDPRVTRYFMTIPEAAELVLQAGAMAQGGEVYVLDMGQPVRIIDLARNMIALSGLTVADENHPDGDIEIKFVGLRDGEKLYEELLIGDNPTATSHPRIMKAAEPFLKLDELMQQIDLLNEALVQRDHERIREILKELVPGYEPSLPFSVSGV